MTNSRGNAPDILKGLAREIDASLAGCFVSDNIPERLGQAMRYSLNLGGKRVRPALCLSFAGLFGLERARVMPFACALECIHTYSLIHDDLPAMDNDDMRRGQPSNHIVFGEAMAILAGDSLLTEALGLMAEVEDVPANNLLRAITVVAEAAGASGMGGGQALDMIYEGRTDVTLEQVLDMQARKTGALLKGSCLSGATLAGASEADLAWVAEYGRNLGAAFQIADDIMDEIGDEKTIGKPVGSDRRQGKNTIPYLVGIDRSRELAYAHADLAVKSLANRSVVDQDIMSFLRNLAMYVVERVC